MEILGTNDHLTIFTFEGVSQPVEFRETEEIPGYPGVKCDDYDFVGDDSKDLGVIRISEGCSTPRQKINDRKDTKRTVERYASGNGRLIVKKKDGPTALYEISSRSLAPLSVDVEIGDTMQWQADPDSNLVVYEICIPRFKPGRYTNL